MGQFDSFTQSVGDSFVGLIGSVGRNIVCPVGCAVCAVMCILSIIGAISSYNLENGRSSEFWRKCFAAAICLFGAVSMGAIWRLFADYFQ